MSCNTGVLAYRSSYSPDQSSLPGTLARGLHGVVQSAADVTQHTVNRAFPLTFISHCNSVHGDSNRLVSPTPLNVGFRPDT